jgi:mRNA interferase MazF
MVKKKYIPDRMDIVWIDLNPTKGHEQSNVRPVLVLSPVTYNELTGLMVACAITSHIKGYPFEVLLNEKKTRGAVLSDQIRCLDWRSRKVRFIETASPEVFAEIQENIGALLFD